MCLFVCLFLFLFFLERLFHDWYNKGFDVLVCLWDGVYELLLAAKSEVVADVVAIAGFLSRCLKDSLLCPTLYNRK